MNNLNNESKCFSKGQLIYKNLEKACNKELEIYIVDVKKDNFIEENMNLQSMITFFIDGASAIPIENNFWHYFLLFENDQVFNFYITIERSSETHWILLYISFSYEFE